jgi:hypothetical protein
MPISIHLFIVADTDDFICTPGHSELITGEPTLRRNRRKLMCNPTFIHV